MYNEGSKLSGHHRFDFNAGSITDIRNTFKELIMNLSCPLRCLISSIVMFEVRAAHSFALLITITTDIQYLFTGGTPVW